MRRDFPDADHLPLHIMGFALCTEIPGFRISTVGDFRPVEGGPRRQIGWNRLYETMVFRIAPGDTVCSCGCGAASESRIDYGEPVELIPANTAEEAERNHEIAVASYLARLGPAN